MSDSIVMKGVKVSVTTHALEALEAKLRLKLPAAYRAWLLRFNGGTPVPGEFKYKTEEGPYTDSRVAFFYAVYDGEYENFEKQFINYKVTQRRMLDNLIPFARDPFGNCLCLSISGADEGAVYFWDHEEEPATPSYANCHLIADTFDEFIGGLH